MLRSLYRRSHPLVSTVKVAPKDGSSTSFPFSNGLNRMVQSTRSQFIKTQSGSLPHLRWRSASGCTQLSEEQEHNQDLFDELEQRFLRFKRHKYLTEYKKFQALAEAQNPKLMVIGCADSRVCPSIVLGFQPGEAFMIRNVANLVPPLQNGMTETNSALEFAVTTLLVEDIIVVGHSNCGGIQALMSMHNDQQHPSLVEKWVVNGISAKLRTQAAVPDLDFDQKCKYCEKESINDSLKNLLTYPWVEERVRRGLLAIHGGYYDMNRCTFERWRLCLDESSGRYFVSDKRIWC